MEMFNIRISQVDASNKKYRISYPDYSLKITESIKEIGLKCPIVLEKISEEKYIIAHGIKRFNSLKELGYKEIPCIILDYKDGLNIFIEQLYDNITTRSFNDIEKSLVVEKLINEFKVSRVKLKNIFSILNISFNEHTINKLLKAASLEDKLKELIFKNKLRLQTALNISMFNKTDQDYILDLIEKLDININLNDELIEYLKQILKKYVKEFSSIKDVFVKLDLEKVLDNKEMNSINKIEILRIELRKKCFPNLVEYEKEFLEFKNSINLPKDAKINVTPFFEKDEYTLELKFKDKKDFLEKINQLIILDKF